jgi:hypothetical protein
VSSAGGSAVCRRSSGGSSPAFRLTGCGRRASLRHVLHAVRLLRSMAENEAGLNHWFPRSGPRSGTAAVPVAPSPVVGVARTEGAAGDLRRDPADPLRTDC